MCGLLGKASRPRAVEGPARAEEPLAGVRASPGDPPAAETLEDIFPSFSFYGEQTSSRMLPRGRLVAWELLLVVVSAQG